MAADAERVTGTANDPCVMAAIDEEDKSARLVLADISRDDAWISARLDAVCSLSTWR